MLIIKTNKKRGLNYEIEIKKIINWIINNIINKLSIFHIMVGNIMKKN